MLVVVSSVFVFEKLDKVMSFESWELGMKESEVGI
jgi:hypothetical protein